MKRRRGDSGDSATAVGDDAAAARRGKRKLAMPPALARAARCSRFVGAHVSGAGGLDKAIANAEAIGAAAFALFLKSQRQWAFKPLDDDVVTRFRAEMARARFAPHHVLPHGSYLVNLASPNEEMRARSYATWLDDLRRCSALGLSRYNFHPGSCEDEAAGVERIADAINRAVAEVPGVVCVLENMAGQGHHLGARFEQLAAIIARVSDKSRVGVCLDTCHLYGAGYDVRTESSFARVMDEFDRIVGARYLMAMHLNDSKCDLASKKDRHESIGKGLIGLECFRFIMNDARFKEIPLILETPAPEKDVERVYRAEIDLLYSLASNVKK